MKKLIYKYTEELDLEQYEDFLSKSDEFMLDTVSINSLLTVMGNVKSSLKLQRKLSDKDIEYVCNLIDEYIVIFDRGYKDETT